MSARSRRFVLTSEARSDLRMVLAFTEKEWGASRRRQYRKLLWEAIAELARFPLLGRARPEFGPDFRSRLVRQHVIVYQPTDAEIIITRILHVRRDIAGELEETPN